MAITIIRTILIATLASLALGCAAPAMDHATSVESNPKAGCLVPGAWHRLEDGRPLTVSGADVLDRAASQDVVLLGEYHTSADDHRWQLQTLAALHLLHPHMVIGFESFPRRLQPVLDKWVAGELSVKQFLQQSEWKEVWDYPAELYLPLFQFARINRIPMIALNVDLSLPAAVRKHGWDAVPASQKEGISRPAAPPAGYVDMLYDVFRQHASSHGSTGMDKTSPAFRHFVQAQSTWDGAMAQALAQQVRSDQGGERPLAVGIMGAGHVRDGYGVPFQLHALGIDRVAVLLPVDAEHGCQPFHADYADAVFALPDHPVDKPQQAPPPRLGIQLESMHGGVRIVDVMHGSLAQHTGFRPGDEITAIGGARVHDMQSVISAVHAQPPGSWLPVQVRRDGKTLDLIVKFPPKR